MCESENYCKLGCSKLKFRYNYEISRISRLQIPLGGLLVEEQHENQQVHKLCARNLIFTIRARDLNIGRCIGDI
jgi:hypothetical protein